MAVTAMAAAHGVVVAIGVDASTLDPHRTTDSATESINKNLYNNLVRFDADMQIVPDLATHWTVSEDGRTWTFYLREGVRFHDGTALDAEAAKRSFERLLDPANAFPRASLHADIVAVEVVGPHAVSVTTERPAGALLARMAHPSAAIVSMAAVERWGDAFGQHPVGSGPFKFDSWTPGEEIVLVRNDDYFRGAPVISHVTYRVVPEESVRTLMLQAGEVDVAVGIPPDQLPLLQRMRNVEIKQTPSTMMMYMAMNGQKKPFDDVRVRQAMNYAVNKEEIVEFLLSDLADVADSPLSPVIWGYASTGVYEYNPERAKQLLAEAGYPNGFSMSLWTPVGRYLQDLGTAEVVQAQLAEVGIDVRVETWEFGAYIEEIKKAQFDMVLLGWSPSTGDADWGLFPVFHSTQWPPMSNRALYGNPDVDALLIAAQTEPDQHKRRELYRELQQIIFDDAPWIFLWSARQIVAHRSGLEGMEIIPVEHILFENASFK